MQKTILHDQIEMALMQLVVVFFVGQDQRHLTIVITWSCGRPTLRVSRNNVTILWGLQVQNHFPIQVASDFWTPLYMGYQMSASL